MDRVLSAPAVGSATRHTAYGFTLLEVMLAVAVLAVGIGSSFSALGSATRTSERARMRDLALEAISTVIEDIRPTLFMNIDGYKDRDIAVKGLTRVPGHAEVIHISFISSSTAQVRMHIRADWVDQQGAAFHEIDYIATKTH